MQLDINNLYKLINESIQQVVRENFQYNLMEVFGDDEIQLTLEDGKLVNIYVNIESEEDLDQEENQNGKRRYNIAKYDDITLREMLELGFNNNYLNKRDDYSYIKELGWCNEKGNYEYDFTDEQLNVKIEMKEYDADTDGYTFARIYLKNEEDYKLFEDFGEGDW